MSNGFVLRSALATSASNREFGPKGTGWRRDSLPAPANWARTLAQWCVANHVAIDSDRGRNAMAEIIRPLLTGEKSPAILAEAISRHIRLEQCRIQGLIAISVGGKLDAAATISKSVL